LAQVSKKNDELKIGGMSRYKHIEESWEDNGLIDNIRLRWILRKVRDVDNNFDFVAQIECLDKGRWVPLIRLDKSHGYYHMDMITSSQIRKIKIFRQVSTVEEQIDVAFNEFASIKDLLSKYELDIFKQYFIGNWDSYINRLGGIKSEICFKLKAGLDLGDQHVSQAVKVKTIVVGLSMKPPRTVKQK